MIYCSFVTKNTPYEKVANYYIIPSMKKYNLPYDIDYIKNTGNWSKNVLYKSKFLKKMLLKHKQSIVCLDCDAELKKEPILFNELKEYDFACHFLNHGMQWMKRPSKKIEALGGTLYLNYNEKVLEFLDKWIELTKIEKGWPQKLMQKLLEKNEFNLNIYKLPYSYSTIILRGDIIPIHMIKPEDVVILHHQMSRHYKYNL